MESILDVCKVRFTYVSTMKNRLRELRTKRGWSQQELAERLGVSRQTVNAIEAERHDASLTLALKIGKVFGLPVETIFKSED
jgi:putative transcriptional regulator